MKSGREHIHNHPRSKARIPTGPSDPETILRVLKPSNTHLPTHNWRVANVTDQWSHYGEMVIPPFNTPELIPEPAEKLVQSLFSTILSQQVRLWTSWGILQRHWNCRGRNLCYRTMRRTLMWQRLTLWPTLRIIQVNLRHSKTASAALLLRLATEDVELIRGPGLWSQYQKISLSVYPEFR